MNCCPPTFFPIAAVLAAMVLPLLAQQPIIFSKPADAGGAAKADATLAPETKHEVHSLFNLPMSIFEPSHPGQTLAPASVIGPAPQVSADQLKAWQKILDAKNHWTLMTPEEILGLPTPEKILGLPAKNGEDKLSLEERFTRRRERAAGLLETTGAASPQRRPDALLRNNESPFAHKPFESVFAPSDEKKSAAQSAATASAGRSGSFLGSLLNSPFSSADKPDSRWGNAFNLPLAAPKNTPEQLAGMDRFRASMQPALVFEKAAEARRAAAPMLAKDPFMNNAPNFNPRGSSFAPLKSDVARPRGLTPLPGIGTRPLATPTRSASQPELPPWMREDFDRPAGMPQRKF